MAEKKSFLLYASDLEMLGELTMEERGQLLTAIYGHVTGGEMPEMSSAAKVAFFFVKKSLDRDGKKYEETVSRNRANGAKGGRPRKKKAEDDEEEAEPESENPVQTQNNPTITQTKPSNNPEVTQKNMITDNCYLITDICTPLSGGNTRTREDAAWVESLALVLTAPQLVELDRLMTAGLERDLVAWAVTEAATRAKGWEYARAILSDKLAQGIKKLSQLRSRGRPRKAAREVSYDGEAFDRLWLELPPAEA